jgi:hypothetical protein
MQSLSKPSPHYLNLLTNMEVRMHFGCGRFLHIRRTLRFSLIILKGPSKIVDEDESNEIEALRTVLNTLGMMCWGACAVKKPMSQNIMHDEEESDDGADEEGDEEDEEAADQHQDEESDEAESGEENEAKAQRHEQ